MRIHWSFQLHCSWRSAAIYREDGPSPWKRVSASSITLGHFPPQPFPNSQRGWQWFQASSQLTLTSPWCDPKRPLGTTSKTSEDGCNLLRCSLYQMIQNVSWDQFICSVLLGLKNTWRIGLIVINISLSSQMWSTETLPGPHILFIYNQIYQFFPFLFLLLVLTLTCLRYP